MVSCHGSRSVGKPFTDCAEEPCCLPSSFHAKIQLYCGPNGPTASIFYGIWIKQSGAIVFIFNLDKVLLKKLFSTMNI